MKDLVKYILVGAGAFLGIRYYNAYEVVKKIKFSFANFSVDLVNAQQINLGIWLNVVNPTSERLTITNSNLNIFLNSINAGKCLIPYTQIIEANTTTKIFIVAQVYYKNAFSQWWNTFLQAATNVALVISGNLRFNGVFLAIPAITVKEFNLSNAITEIVENK